jgi:hypothetical protein
MAEGSNSYFDVLGRIADSLAKVSEGYLECLKGRRYDFSTDDGVREAVRDVVISLGGEVRNA